MAELLALSTTVSAQSDAFVRGIEQCRGGLRNLIASLDPAAQATDRFNKNMGTLDRALAQGKISTSDYAVYMERLRQRLADATAGQGRLAVSTGQLRGGMQQLSYQIGDVAQGFAAGTPPMTIFIQQSGQVIQAVQLMTNSTKGFIGFLAGPWGAVLTGAVTIAATFGLSLLKVGDNADDAAKRIDGVTDALERLRKEQGNEADIAVGEGELNKLRDQRLTILRRIDQIDRLNLDPRLAAEMQKRLTKLEQQIGAKQAEVNFNRATLDTRQRSNPPRASAPPRGSGNAPAVIGSAAPSQQEILQQFLGQMREDSLRALQQVTLPYQIGGPQDPLQKALATDDYFKELRERTAATAQAVGEIKKSWESAGTAAVQMTNDSLNALSNLANSIKSGGILDVVRGVFGVLGALGGSGVIKGDIGKFFGAFAGFRESGGPVSAGRAYVVGEKRPELFVPDRSGYIIPSIGNEASAGRVRVEVVPSPYFNAVVDGRAQAAAAPIAMRAASAGSSDAQQAMARRGKNRIPGR